MTLIITCLTHEHIVQVSDRRLTYSDGRLYDDDTNKALFYCGRVAVAYTGIAYINNTPTAEWIGSCMKDVSTTEDAMYRVAERAEQYFRASVAQDKRLAIVATGWATLYGEYPVRPFICVASNFLTDSWEWLSSATDRVVVRTIFLEESSSYLIFPAGQNLTSSERVYLSRCVRKAIEHSATSRALARILVP
jgi:hypothetical protein